MIPAPLVPLLEALPTADQAVSEQAMQAFLKGGPATVSKLVELVGPEFGDEQGVKPKYALHGLAHYASRPGADADRKMVAETLAKELAQDHSDELKAFICRQLQLCGRPEEVPALATLLTSDRLCEPATQALSAIGGEKAVAALRSALPLASGGRRTTLINALGRFQDKQSAAEIRKSADAQDTDQRLVAWYALASCGDAGSADVLLKAAETDVPYERSQATDACLRLARRLSETGDQSNAEKICRALLAKRKAADDVHVRCAALETLAVAIGPKAVRDVLEALDSKDVKFRHPAARTAVDLAVAIRKDHSQEADQLLNKVLDATEEEAVRQQAELLLGKYDT
jgi:HEAT repeat protein